MKETLKGILLLASIYLTFYLVLGFLGGFEFANEIVGNK